jgi:hypothetical protein
MHSVGSLHECKYSFNARIWNTLAANYFNGYVDGMNYITVLVQCVELDYGALNFSSSIKFLFLGFPFIVHGPFRTPNAR